MAVVLRPMDSIAAAFGAGAGRPLAERRSLYSSVAEAYLRTRPRYPQHIVDAARNSAALSPQARVLEIGCGPATLTTQLAEAGCRVEALEPNPEFCALAREACARFRHVQIHNQALEEWPQEAGAFEAVVAASSLHWVPAEVALPKAATALQPGGHLILFWNMSLQVTPEVHAALADLYARHAPGLDRRESMPQQEAMLAGFARGVEEGGLFALCDRGAAVCQYDYAAEDYLQLLCTTSPYLALAPGARESLLEGMRPRLEGDFGGRLSLRHLSAFQVFKLR
ncbi:class I SAM-dependent methyltransferase [Niveibacterium sp. SC-1]|uniref:class I SAM-dependent methyltransferase n=1 Tax=Niveibacterium sp. SC-1 TaxID=3135646 RepID=UPI00311FDE81